MQTNKINQVPSQSLDFQKFLHFIDQERCYSFSDLLEDLEHTADSMFRNADAEVELFYKDLHHAHYNLVLIKNALRAMRKKGK